MILRLACVAVLVLVVAGCSNDAPEPSALPSTSVSPSVTSGVSASPTPLAAPTGRDAASARAFVRYWVRELNRASATGDTAALASLSESSCRSCNGLRRTIRQVYDAGGRFENGRWRISKIEARHRKAAFSVDATANVAAQAMTKRRGEDAINYPPGQLHLVFELSPHGEGWRVAQVDKT